MVIIDLSRRELIQQSAMDAAFEANGKREVNYTTELLIKVAVDAALDKLEKIWR